MPKRTKRYKSSTLALQKARERSRQKRMIAKFQQRLKISRANKAVIDSIAIPAARAPTASEIYLRQRRLGGGTLEVAKMFKTGEELHPLLNPEDIKVVAEEGNNYDNSNGDMVVSNNSYETGYFEDEEPCLVCSRKGAGNITKGIPVFPGADGCTNKHLWSMFLLRNILQYPPDECEKIFLRTCGILNPGSWYSLCESCFEKVKEAVEIHLEILKLEEQMSSLKKEIRKKLTVSLELGEEKDEDVYCISQEIRQYFRGFLFVTNDVREDWQVTYNAGTENGLVEGQAEADIVGTDFSMDTIDDSCLFRSSSEVQVEVNKEEICDKDQLQKENSEKMMYDLLGNHFEGVFVMKKPKTNKRYICDMCGRSFSGPRPLEDHQAMHLNNNKGVFNCETCGLYFTARLGLRAHNKKFHGGLPEVNQTPTPAETASSLTFSLPSENSSIPNPPTSSKFERACKHCNLKVVNRSVLKLHLKTAHSNLYTHKCDLCDASYMTRHNLGIHKEATHSNRKAKCQYCGAEFTSYISIYEHLRKYCKKYDGKAKRISASAPDNPEVTTSTAFEQSDQFLDNFAEVPTMIEQSAPVASP